MTREREALVTRAREAGEKGLDPAAECMLLARYLILVRDDMAPRLTVPRAGTAGGRTIVSRSVTGTEAELERARVFSRHLGRLAAANQHVRMFRKSLIGGPMATLSAARTRRLLASPALRILTWGELHERGVPLDGTHTSSLKSLPDGFVSVSIRWPGHLPVTFIRSQASAETHLRLPGHAQPVVAGPQSFLQVLAAHAQMIGEPNGWTEPEAIEFLLIGKVPLLPPLRVERETHVRRERNLTKVWVNVRVMPGVSPESVRQAYAQEDWRLAGHRKGRDIRPRNLALLDFVIAVIARGWPTDWPGRLKMWNEKHPKWAYAFASRMRHDYEATAQRVLLLDLRLGHGPGPCGLDVVERLLAARPDAPSFFLEEGLRPRPPARRRSRSKVRRNSTSR
jgi:hypothetical protein